MAPTNHNLLVIQSEKQCNHIHFVIHAKSLPDFPFSSHSCLLYNKEESVKKDFYDQ